MWSSLSWEGDAADPARGPGAVCGFISGFCPKASKSPPKISLKTEFPGWLHWSCGGRGAMFRQHSAIGRCCVWVKAQGPGLVLLPGAVGSLFPCSRGFLEEALSLRLGLRRSPNGTCGIARGRLRDWAGLHRPPHLHVSQASGTANPAPSSGALGGRQCALSPQRFPV